MENLEPEKSNEKICNLSYLSETMGKKKQLVKEIIDLFLIQFPEELQSINEAVTKIDYAIIKNFSHTMKSTVSIMGITALRPILQEMEDLGGMATNIEKIQELNQKLILMCQKVVEEIEKEKHNYI